MNFHRWERRRTQTHCGAAAVAVSRSETLRWHRHLRSCSSITHDPCWAHRLHEALRFPFTDAIHWIRSDAAQEQSVPDDRRTHTMNCCPGLVSVATCGFICAAEQEVSEVHSTMHLNQRTSLSDEFKSQGAALFLRVWTVWDQYLLTNTFNLC